MAEISIRDLQGKVKERREIQVRPPRLALLKQAVVRAEANQRAGTAATKVRSQVTGSRRKPWRQKGTGRARSGDRRSPLWRGGGTIFGPHPRDFSQDLPRRARRGALADALLGKVRDSEVVAVEEFPLDPPKTKQMADLLGRMGIEGSCLVAVGPYKEPPPGHDTIDAAYTAIHRMTRNLPRVQVTRVEDLNVRDLLRHRHLLVSKAGVDYLFPPKPQGEE